MTATQVLLLGSFLALSAASVELATVGYRVVAARAFVHVDWNILWMAPLSYGLFVVPLSIALLVGSHFAPRLFSPQVVSVGVALPTTFSVLFLAYPRVHLVAVLLLSLGISVQLTRMIMRDLSATMRIARRTVLMLGVLSVASGVVLSGIHALREQRALRALPTAAGGMPNVLLLILDTVRASSLSLYGHDRATTPLLDSMARNSVVFEHAYSTAPWTLTSHASVFTGRYPFELSATWTTPLDDRYATLAELLSGAGYRTGGFVANLLYTGAETGLARGFQRYEDYTVSPSEIAISSSLGRIILNNPRLRRLVGYHDIPGRRTARDITAAFIDWLGPTYERPFFAFLNFYDAHEPYLPPEPFASSFSSGVPRQNHLIRQANTRSADRIAKESMSEPERREEERAYEAAIASIVDQIGELLRELEIRGVLANTLVVVTSDHGELFGEHGLFAHGGELYTPVLHVPLLLSGPGVPGGVRVEDAVSLVDLGSTMLQLAGIANDGALSGNSLSHLWNDAESPGGLISPVFAEVEPARNQPPGLPSERGPLKSLTRYPWHYILNGDGVEELYDLAVDPEESMNLAGARAHQDVLTQMRTGLRNVSDGGI